MQKLCHSIGCTEQVFFGCSCSNSMLSCQAHISSHLLSFGQHIPSKLMTRIQEDQKENLIKNLIESKKLIKNNIEKLKEFSQMVIKSIEKESNKTIQMLSKEYDFFKQSLKLFLSKSMIDVEYLESITIKNEKSLNRFHFQFEKIEMIIRDTFNLDIWEYSTCDDNYAIIFNTSSSKYIDMVSLDNFTKITTNLHLGKLIERCICCKINNSQYFVYGGGPSSKLQSAKIIDIKNKTYQILPSDSVLYQSGGCLFKNEIYIFGGFNETEKIKESKKYSILSKTWHELASLPKKIDFSSACSVNGKIFITGPDIEYIYLYEPELNRYSISKFPVDSGNKKFFVKNWLVWFSRALLELDNNENLISYHPITHSASCLNSSAYFLRGKFIYFTTQCLKLFRIDTVSKILELVSYG